MEAAPAGRGASVPDPERDRAKDEELKQDGDGQHHREEQAKEAGAGAAGGGGGEAEEEEEGECAFCVYMRSGPCGTEFKQWEECVNEADKLTDEVVIKCKDTTQSLMKCMEGFTDYYGVVLQAGQKMGDQSTESSEAAPSSSGPEAAENPSSSQRDGSASRAEDEQQQKPSSLQPQPAQILESGELSA